MRTMIPGIELELGGTAYIVPPLSLPALRLLEPRLKAMRGGLDDDAQRVMLDATYLALSRNYPDITRLQIEGRIELDGDGNIVVNDEGLLPDIATMQRVFLAVLDVSGVKRAEVEAGKAQAAGAASTGTASTAT